MKYIFVFVLFVCLSSAPLCWGQGFNKGFLFGQRLLAFSNVTELADGTFFVCGHYINPAHDRLGSIYLKLDANGNFVDSLLVAEQGQSLLLADANNELRTNANGNFVVCMGNANTTDPYRLEVQEVDPESLTLVNRVVLDSLTDSLHFVAYANPQILYSSENAYFMSYSALDIGIPPDMETSRMGVNWVQFNADLEVTRIKRFYLNSAFGLLSGDAIQIGENLFLLLMSRRKQAGTNSEEVSHTVIKKINAQGDELWNWESFDNQKDLFPRALTPTIDGGYLYTYFQGRYIDQGSGGWEYIPILRKLNQFGITEWTMKLGSDRQAEYPFTDIIPINDTLFVAAGGVQHITEEDTLQTGGRLLQFTLDGEKVWERSFFYFPQNYPAYQYIPSHQIKDVARTSDGGYIVAGHAIDYELSTTGAPTDYGWVVKLNCLGFLGAPQAGVSLSIEDNYTVVFRNTSTQGGRFFWDFGDGTTLETTEKEDTIYHTYSGFGTFSARLIALGCGEEADTLDFMVSPKLHAHPETITKGEGHFTFFPNPVTAGNVFYVYLNGSSSLVGKEVALRFYNNEGQHVTDYRLSNQQGAYLIHPTLAAGVYHVGLLVDNKTVQVRKLVVN